MSLFQHKIFDEFFTVFERENDSYRNVLTGTGFMERTVDVLEAYQTDEIHAKSVNLYDNVKYFETCLLKFIPYIEKYRGFDDFINSLVDPIPEDVRRWLCRFYNLTADRRGTLVGYTTMLRWLALGCSLDITYPDGGRFDDGGTFDDGGRFDDNCPGCMPYTIYLFGDYEYGYIVSTLRKAIMTVITYNQPDDMRLVNLYYNGISLLGDFGSDFNNDFLI